MIAAVALSVVITRPMLADVVDQRAMNEEVRGNYRIAISLARRALTMDSHAYGAAARIIQMEREEGHLSLALADADAFKAASSNPVVRAERARVLFAMKRYREAGRAFDAELNDTGSLRLRGRRFVLADALFAETAWELVGDRAAARIDARRGLQIDPGNPTLAALAKRL
jgi:tetratricopeptide (TPR) repeat protein